MSAAKRQRLRPGELDGQVLAYMRRQKNHGPLTATAIANGIERSAGAIQLSHPPREGQEGPPGQEAPARLSAYVLKDPKQK